MKQIINNLIRSFDTKEGGFSSRKLTAFVIVLMVIVTHIKWLTMGNLTQLEMVLTIDYGFIAALFGMTTYHAIKSKVDSSSINEIVEEPTKEIVEEPTKE